MPEIDAPAATPPPATQPQEPGMLLPFTSPSWDPFFGKYGEGMVHLFVDGPDTASTTAALMRRSKGRRVVVFQNAGANTFTSAADRLQGKFNSLWWPHGLAATKSGFQAIINDLAFRKCDLDFAVFDIENTANFWTLNANDLAAIYADPRYAALVATGNFPADCRSMNEEAIMQFNYGCQVLFNAAVQECLIGPLYSKYPNLGWSNFNDYPITKADAQIVRELNGHAAYWPASKAPYYSPANYAGVGQLGNLDARYKTPWWCVAWVINTWKCVYRAKSTAKLLPWVGARVDSNVLDLANWCELVYHTCCLAGPRILYFNGDDFTALSNWRFDNCIAQYTAAAKGKVWSKTLVTDLTDYVKDKVVVTAARSADNSTVGRVTFKPGVTSATITVAGKTLNVKPDAGSVGCWFHF